MEELYTQEILKNRLLFLIYIITNPYIILILSRHNFCGGFIDYRTFPVVFVKIDWRQRNARQICSKQYLILLLL